MALSDDRSVGGPRGESRVLLAFACVAAGLLAGGFAGIVVVGVGSAAGAGIGALVLGFGFGLLVAVVWVVWLSGRARLGRVLGWSAAGLTAVAVYAFAAEWAAAASIGLTAPVMLAAIAWLTDPGRQARSGPGDRTARLDESMRRDRPTRRWRLGMVFVVLLVVLAAIPPVVRDLRDWREMTAAIEELGDPPLAPTAPGLGIAELSQRASGVVYLVTDADGTAFASVWSEALEGPLGQPAEDCFSTELRDAPMVGCTEIAPGTYRAEFRNDRGRFKFFIPRSRSLVQIRAHVTGDNLAKYGTDGASEELLRQVATSLRPVPVQDLAQRTCRLCRLLPR